PASVSRREREGIVSTLDSPSWRRSSLAIAALLAGTIAAAVAPLPAAAASRDGVARGHIIRGLPPAHASGRHPRSQAPRAAPRAAPAALPTGPGVGGNALVSP